MYWGFGPFTFFYVCMCVLVLYTNLYLTCTINKLITAYWQSEVSVRVCYSDCNVCGEVKTATESSINIIVECGCGVSHEDIMVEEDRLYPVYQQILGQWEMVSIDKDRDNHPLTRNGRIS